MIEELRQTEKKTKNTKKTKKFQTEISGCSCHRRVEITKSTKDHHIFLVQLFDDTFDKKSFSDKKKRISAFLCVGEILN